MVHRLLELEVTMRLHQPAEERVSEDEAEDRLHRVSVDGSRVPLVVHPPDVAHHLNEHEIVIIIFFVFIYRSSKIFSLALP